MSEDVLEEKSEAAAFQEFIDALDPDAKTMFAEAALGRDASEFFRTDVGRYMVGCAQQDHAEAMSKLKTTAPWRRRRIQQLQNEARVAEMFLTYLRDLIIRGKSAERSLEEREES